MKTQLSITIEIADDFSMHYKVSVSGGDTGGAIIGIACGYASRVCAVTAAATAQRLSSAGATEESKAVWDGFEEGERITVAEIGSGKSFISMRGDDAEERT